MNRKRKGNLSLPSIIFACLIYLFLYLPIMMVIVYSFNANETNIVFSGFSSGGLNSRVNDAEAKQLVQWILTLQ